MTYDRVGQCWMFRWTAGLHGPERWCTVIFTHKGDGGSNGELTHHRGLHTDEMGHVMMASTSENNETMTFEDEQTRNCAWRIG